VAICAGLQLVVSGVKARSLKATAVRVGMAQRVGHGQNASPANAIVRRWDFDCDIGSGQPISALAHP